MQLLVLLSLSLSSLALGSPSDVLYIEKLNADNAQLLDTKNFTGLANVFTKNASYNPGYGPNIIGIDNIQTTLASLFQPELISQRAITTQSITLLPPFDEQGAAATATGVVYLTIAQIGQGDLAGQALIVFGKFVDKYVKTGDFGRYGGWRISERVGVRFVS
ncbi:hypothetical protein MMC22_006103 [Lobaria immixta]|nr:hypothetical protein [Lobaria immixta]